jgi:hypothetical protein
MGIREKLWNIEEIVSEIKSFPQTYQSILGDECDDNTCQKLLRKKLNQLVKEGRIYKATIPGTRFGQLLFYTEDKEYHIIVMSTRTGSEVYCFKNYKHVSRYYLELSTYWLLNKEIWIKKRNKTLFEGNVLLFI